MISITLVSSVEVIWRFLEWKSKTLVQHLANLTNHDLRMCRELDAGSYFLVQDQSAHEVKIPVYVIAFPCL